MSPAAEVLITGAGRGLGRALALEFARRGWRVTGLMRRPDRADADLRSACARVLACDLARPGAFAGIGAMVGKIPLDCLIHNAAIRGDTGGLPSFAAADFARVMALNVAAPVLLTRALLPLMPARGKVAFISSRAGSMAEGADPDGDYAYVASKAALNRLTVKLSQDFPQCFLSLHPGWVRTDMGGGDADLDPGDAARGLADRIEAAGPTDSGSFQTWEGVSVGW